MGELLPLLAYPPLATMVREFSGDDVFAWLATACSHRAVGPCVAAALREADYWHGVWADFVADNLIRAVEDAALDAFVLRHHHSQDYFGFAEPMPLSNGLAEPGPPSDDGGFLGLFADEGWPLALAGEGPHRSRPVRTYGWAARRAHRSYAYW